MKKELKELLSKEEGTLQINEMFMLRRVILKSNNDILGRNVDCLELEMTNKYGKTRSGSIEIQSRDTEGIQKEVAEAMEKMLYEFKETLVKSWNGGYLF